MPTGLLTVRSTVVEAPTPAMVAGFGATRMVRDVDCASTGAAIAKSAAISAIAPRTCLPTSKTSPNPCIVMSSIGAQPTLRMQL